MPFRAEIPIEKITTLQVLSPSISLQMKNTCNGKKAKFLKVPGNDVGHFFCELPHLLMPYAVITPPLSLQVKNRNSVMCECCNNAKALYNTLKKERYQLCPVKNSNRQRQ